MSSNLATYPSLKGMPVIVSGGASGIGEGIVREFAAQGSKVGFVDIAGERGEAVAAELAAAGDDHRHAIKTGIAGKGRGHGALRSVDTERCLAGGV